MYTKYYGVLLCLPCEKISPRRSFERLSMRTSPETSAPAQEPRSPYRYGKMLPKFYHHIIGKKEKPCNYQHDYHVQEILDEIIGGMSFYGKNIG